MSIVAALDKVLFFNASSKYSVLRMKTEDSSVPTEARSPYRYHDHLIRFTAVGIELPQTDTVKIVMDGEWKDGKYGLQLQVDHWQEIVPPTLEGVRNYLASGLLKGIGEKTADAIIEKFGVNALEILEHQPDRLLEIRGITKERLAEIKDAYAETSRMRVLMTLLAPFKVTPTTAQKIYQHFGPACADIVRQSPFNLCQVPGFGFKRIDAIVQKSGGDLRDPKRVHGALFYALEDARTKDGHLYLEAEALLKAAMQLLNERIPLPQMRVPMSQVEQELSAMIRQDEVVSNHGNVYLPKQFLQESETAQKAVELFLAKPTVVDITQPLERVKNSLGLNLSKRQSEGVEMVFRHNLSIITGGPGTGKTTVLKTVIEVYRQLYPRQKIVLGAPTGKASRRMAEATGIDEAQTLHSILGLHGDSESKKDRERKPLEAGLLIVDETSMVDMWLIHQLFSRLRPGTKVLLVGDADQLESVGAGDVFHELIGSGVVPVTVLDEIFRQAQDSLIAHNARFINEGKTTLYYGEDFAFHKAESQEETAGIIRELYQEQIATKGIEQVEILSPFRSEGEASVNSLNEAIREEINPASPDTPEIVYAGKIFRLNDRVMQMRNNYDIKLYAYKGFEPDLSCRGHRFVMGKNVTPEANCASNGFHCAEDPLDCLTYYSDMDRSIYCLVQPCGDIDEDDRDSKIACTELTILRQLTRKEFFLHALAYMVDHPCRKVSGKVQREHGVSRGGYAIVRGKAPAACGKLGDILAFARERRETEVICQIAVVEVDGEKILPDVWYDIDFVKREAVQK